MGVYGSQGQKLSYHVEIKLALKRIYRTAP